MSQWNSRRVIRNLEESRGVKISYKESTGVKRSQEELREVKRSGVKRIQREEESREDKGYTCYTCLCLHSMLLKCLHTCLQRCLNL